MVNIICYPDRKERSKVLWNSAISYSFIAASEALTLLSWDS